MRGAGLFGFYELGAGPDVSCVGVRRKRVIVGAGVERYPLAATQGMGLAGDGDSVEAGQVKDEWSTCSGPAAGFKKGSGPGGE